MIFLIIDAKSNNYLADIRAFLITLILYYPEYVTELWLADCTLQYSSNSLKQKSTHTDLLHVLVYFNFYFFHFLNYRCIEQVNGLPGSLAPVSCLLFFAHIPYQYRLRRSRGRHALKRFIRVSVTENVNKSKYILESAQ